MSTNKGSIILPAGGDPPTEIVISRFLAKVAIEAMAQRLVEYPEGLKYIVDKTQLDPMRNHARIGETPNWPVSVHRIYDANQKWIDEKGNQVQMVHEFDILNTPWSEWFFVVAIFGLELAINYGGPEIDGYMRWLSENNNNSPLYYGKNESVKIEKVNG